jgi:hypothetical protein
MGAPLHHYTGQVGPRIWNLGHLWIENDAITSWLMLTSTSDYFPHLHKTYKMFLRYCFAVSRAYGCTLIRGAAARAPCGHWRMQGGESPPGPDIQYEPDVVDLALPRAVVQQPQCISQECLIARRVAPKGVVGASGQGRCGGRGGASVLGLPGGGGIRGQG